MLATEHAIFATNDDDHFELFSLHLMISREDLVEMSSV